MSEQATQRGLAVLAGTQSSAGQGSEQPTASCPCFVGWGRGPGGQKSCPVHSLSLLYLEKKVNENSSENRRRNSLNVTSQMHQHIAFAKGLPIGFY